MPEPPPVWLHEQAHRPGGTVTVTEDGFEHAGENYLSLTKIAKKIT